MSNHMLEIELLCEFNADVSSVVYLDSRNLSSMHPLIYKQSKEIDVYKWMEKCYDCETLRFLFENVTKIDYS